MKRKKWIERPIHWKDIIQPSSNVALKPHSRYNQPFWLWLRCLSFLFFGCLISALAINIFYVPFNFTMGGVSGVAAIIFYITGGAVPFGLLVFLINIPLFILGLREYSLRFVWKSLVGTFIFSVAIDTTAAFMRRWAETLLLPIQNQRPDPLIFAIFGGILFGVGLGLIFLGGYTTGGADIIAVILNKHIRHLSLGQIILIIDVFIICLSLIFHAPTETTGSPVMLALYSFLSLFVSTKAIDIVLGGFDFTRTAFIISDHSEEISTAILQQLDRGVTALQGRGMYSKQTKQVLLCVLSNRQIAALREVVASIDQNAFVIVSDAREVYGEGFAGEKQLF